MDKMDLKYHGKVFNTETGEVVPDDEWIVFRAKDKAVPYMLDAYEEACMRLMCDKNHLERIAKLKTRVLNFQVNYPERCKIPD